ncbi:MAG: glutaredoxin [Alphaproteobacteria bacterium]|nr:glutaredoxin [Alphaproteobacteria bacterium]MCL2758130.1 glutaredoxin [Alphaproteobacteria bacterium]
MKKLFATALLGMLFVGAANAVTLTLYYMPTCPFCHHAKDFVNDYLRDEFPDMEVVTINVSEREHRDRFWSTVRRCGYSAGSVPVITIGEQCFQGFGEATRDEMRGALNAAVAAAAAAAAEAEVATNESASEDADLLPEEPMPGTERQSMRAIMDGTWDMSVFLITLLAIAFASLGVIIFARKK